jgi:hypothetical protein
VLPFGHETRRFQLPGHPGRQLSREPLGGSVPNATQRSFTWTLPITPEQSTLRSGRS